MTKNILVNKFSFLAILILGGLISVSVIFLFPNYKWVEIPILIAQIAASVLFLKLNQENQEDSITAERRKSVVAEKHIKELQEYIAEQEKKSKSLAESKEKFRHVAFHDVLTDLPNRNLFLETLKFILEKHKQTPNYDFAVLFLDLNRFKTINDSLGHLTGDRLILNVAKRLTETVREGDLVARFAGDEFAVILSGTKGIEQAVEVAKLMKQKIAEPFSINGKEVFSSVSIGIATGRKDYADAEDVLRDAGIAMYYAKKRGKGIEIFDPSMHTQAIRLLQVETDLRRAIERGELCAYFQPIIRLDSMKLVGFESLVRWNHPEKGLVKPGEFIPVSEETNLIIPITLWMLRYSCERLVEWKKKSPLNKHLFLSVNLSGKHFAQPDLVAQIRKILFETGIEPGCIKLEITESAVMENPENVIEMLKELKELGVQLSIDDFGTGYSSLSYLHRFPIDTLKIDRSFVSTMEEGSENGEIVNTVISLAKTLGMDVVAEGIETIHQLHQLRVLGCEYGQGYLFSQPAPVEEAERFIEDRTRWQRMLPGASFAAENQTAQTPLEIITTQ